MEKLVQFRDRQEIQAADLSNIGLFASDSLDHVVKDGISDVMGWTEFTVSRSGTAEVTVGPGRVYNSGTVYTNESDVVFDVLQRLPTANKKWVAVVGWGSTADSDTQPRDYLIDATTGATEPKAVPMQSTRVANINLVYGAEAAQPTLPNVDSSNVIIAWVLLNSSDVESVTLVEDNRLPQVARSATKINDLEAWRNLIGPRVDSLASDLARILAMLSQMGQSRLLEEVAIDVARVKEALEIESTSTDYDADRFLTTDHTNLEDVLNVCKVEEGLRFKNDGSQSQALTVFNPINPEVTISNGFLLPHYSEARRFVVGPYAEQQSISQYQYNTHTWVQKSIARQRIRFGEEKTVCTNAAWWQSGRYDSAQQVFYKDGDTWQVENPTDVNKHAFIRLKKFWVDRWTEYYWDRITTTNTVDGQQIGQTFLNGQDGWLTSIGLYFTQKGTTGNIQVSLCETIYGMPDFGAVLNQVTLAVENILTSSDGKTETKVSIPATFLEAGKRYAVVLTTGGNHYVGMAEGSVYSQGSFFYSSDGAYQQGTANKDMMFSLYYANFDKTRTVVQLGSMSLSGGITDIDILAPMIIPSSCNVTFEVQKEDDAAWYPLAEVLSGNTCLYGLPALLLFRASFTGTTDVQAGIKITDSVVNYSRPKTTFDHISNSYTVTSTQNIKVVALLESFKDAGGMHSCACTLRKNGGGAYLAAHAVVDEELDPPVDARDADHKRIKRTWNWTNTELGGAVTAMELKLHGETLSALDTFHVAERIHLCFPA